jgi:hypothetical protein
MALNPSDVANIAKDNPYIQRLIEDADLRDNVRKAVDATRSAFHRLSNGKAPQKALFDDKKLQSDLRVAVTAIREASQSLTDAPRRRARKGLTFGRSLMIAGVGGGLALVGSEKLRSKVLDTLFGAEEEFEYTPPASPTPASPAEPVSAA